MISFPSSLNGTLLALNRFRRGIVLHSYLIGFISVLLLGGSYFYLRGESSQTAVGEEISAASRRTIVVSVKAAGKVTFANEQTLKFNQKGTVAKVLAKEGDRIKKGQIIAELDKTTAMADIRSAQLAAGASTLQLQQLENEKNNAIQDAMNDLRVSQQKLPADLADAKRQVSEREAALEQARLDLEKQRTTEIQSLAMTAQSTIATADSLLDSLYDVLTRSFAARPSQGIYTLEIDHFLYNDPVKKLETENAYLDAVNTANAMHDRYGMSLTSEKNPATINDALADSLHVATLVFSLTENTYDLLQGATTGTSEFTVDDLTAVRSTVSANRAKAQELVSSVQTAQANLAAVSSKDGGIASVSLKQKEDTALAAANALQQAQANLRVLETQTPGDLQSKENALNTALATTDVNLRLKQNDVAQKWTTVSKIAKTVEDYQLKAPFDGVLTHMDYKVGDNLLDTGDTETAELQNTDFIIVTIPLDQVDVVRVQKDMKAVIVFDALPEKQFEGTIDQIDPKPVEQSGVVSYNVLVKLPAPDGITILSGMTAEVTIETAKKENVVAVPNLAIQRSSGRTTVKRENGQSVPVELGVTDGRYTEVTAGLTENERIVSTNVTVQTTNSAANPQQLFRLGGGLGGGAFGGTGGGGSRARGN